MSDDILSKLKALHDDVRARIEATTDFKAMKAVEHAIGELSAALAPVEAAVAEAKPRKSSKQLRGRPRRRPRPQSLPMP